ncbi:thioredoxin family protein [Haloechinothrix halophila]|uniref:thioredoxin family protein n=1 Tax=Haloechinothrix halophila TaxID=1069073 RepID=UPI0003F6FC68|nr:thioredoxin family protein [Haloechinothrix halophila]
MRIEELDTAGLRRVLRDESRAVLVDYWSPWCAPCRTLRPHLEQLADEHRDNARIVAVNVEAETEAAEQFEVASLPTLILFADGEMRRRFTGPTLPSELNQALTALPARG